MFMHILCIMYIYIYIYIPQDAELVDSGRIVVGGRVGLGLINFERLSVVVELAHRSDRDVTSQPANRLTYSQVSHQVSA